MSKYMDHKRKKLIFKSFLNFRRVTHFPLYMLETQVRRETNIQAETQMGVATDILDQPRGR